MLVGALCRNTYPDVLVFDATWISLSNHCLFILSLTWSIWNIIDHRYLLSMPLGSQIRSYGLLGYLKTRFIIAITAITVSNTIQYCVLSYLSHVFQRQLRSFRKSHDCRRYFAFIESGFSEAITVIISVFIWHLRAGYFLFNDIIQLRFPAHIRRNDLSEAALRRLETTGIHSCFYTHVTYAFF